MPDRTALASFPVLQKVNLTGLRPRAGTSIRFAVECEALPAFADPVVHLVAPNEAYTVIFASSLHPAHLPGVKAEADDVLQRHGGAEALSRKLSPRLLAKTSLEITRSFDFVEVVLHIEGSHDLRITEPFARMSRFFEAGAWVKAPVVPTAKPSRTRAKKTPDEVNTDAQKAFHGKKAPKQRKAG